MPKDQDEGKAELVMKAVTILGVAALGVVGVVCGIMAWRGDMTDATALLSTTVGTVSHFLLAVCAFVFGSTGGQAGLMAEAERRKAIREWANRPSVNPRYRGATPAEAGRALLGYRPVTPAQKAAKPEPPVKPGPSTSTGPSLTGSSPRRWTHIRPSQLVRSPRTTGTTG